MRASWKRGFVGLGETICNKRGQTIEVHSTRVYDDKDLTAAEAMAMKISMDHALKENLNKPEFQSDCKTLVNIMKGVEDIIPKNAAGMHCREIWKMKAKFDKVKFEHIRWEKNIAAYSLARVKDTKGPRFNVLEGNLDQSNGSKALL